MATLTDCICDDKVVCKADTGVYNFFQNVMLNKITNNFNNVTEFDFAYSETLQSGNLEQVAIACLNFQRLNLESNFHCLHPLQGLCMIANHCHDLRGLNLKYISVTDMENQLGLWDILSSMSLTHLAVDVCVFHSSSDEMIALFQRCSTLQALQLQCSYDDMCDVYAHDEIRWLLPAVPFSITKIL